MKRFKAFMINALCMWSAVLFAAVDATFQERSIRTKDGFELYSLYREADFISPDQPIILWIHGLGKHAQRFIEPMDYVARCGYASIAFDVRGHGRSGGKRGHFDAMEDIFDDLERVVAAYQNDIKGPLFIVAHSAGGAMLVRYLQQHADNIACRAVILSTPGIKIHPVVLPWWKEACIKCLGKIMPHRYLKLGSDKKHHLTHDETIIARDAADPFIVRQITAHFFATILNEAVVARREAHKLTVPVHVLLAGDDHLVDNQAIMDFYEHVGNSDKSVHVFDGMYHSIFQEIDREDVFRTVVEIFDRYRM